MDLMLCRCRMSSSHAHRHCTPVGTWCCVISAAASLPSTLSFQPSQHEKDSPPGGPPDPESDTNDIVISGFINKIINPDKSFGSSHLWAKLNTNSSSMSLQWNAPLQPDYVITAYTLHRRVPSLKSQSEMWAPPSMPTVQFHTYNPSGILFYQINSVMTDFLGVKLQGGVPWLIFDVSCRWIQQYQNLQRWSVAHCELQNSLVMLSLYVSASVVQSPPVTSVMARALDGFDAVSVQNVGSTYIIVSWDLPTDSNGILISFSLYCNGALAGVLPLTVISYNTTGLLPFTLYMYIYVFSATVCNMRK
eukprot:Em0001g1833a